MQENKWLDLQLFADGGAGSAGDGGGGGSGAANAGENTDAAGRQRLQELGVPEKRLRKNRSYAVAAMAPSSASGRTEGATDETTPEQQPDDTAKQTPPEQPGKRMTWDEIMADPEYNKQMQSVVRSRLRGEGQAQEALGKLAPALEVLARKYGMDPSKLDYEALSSAVNNDEQYYEDKAVEMGTNVETARRLDQMERNQARQQRQEQETLRQQMLRQHFARMEQQGEALKKTFPNFDLREELKNPTFARLTEPSSGLTLEDAYYAVHRQEIQTAAMQVTAQKTAEKLSAAIQAGSRRPQENGSTGQAPATASIDYRKMTKGEREDLKRRIRTAAARGERIYPGQ